MTSRFTSDLGNACWYMSVRPSVHMRSVASTMSWSAGAPAGDSGQQHARRRERLSECADRLVAGAELRDAPAGAGLRHKSAAQGGTKAAVHERGLSAAGRAHNGKEARGRELVDHRSIWLSRPKNRCSSSSRNGRNPGKGFRKAGRLTVHRSVRPEHWRMGCIDAWREKPLSPSIDAGSSSLDQLLSCHPWRARQGRRVACVSGRSHR